MIKMIKNVFCFVSVIATAGDEKPIEIHSGEESSGSSNDYSDRRSLAITIPDYSVLEINNEKFHVSDNDEERCSIDFGSLFQVFNIHIAGKIFFSCCYCLMMHRRSTFVFKTLSRI